MGVAGAPPHWSALFGKVGGIAARRRPCAPGNTHVYAQYTIRVPDRDEVAGRLKAQGYRPRFIIQNVCTSSRCLPARAIIPATFPCGTGGAGSLEPAHASFPGREGPGPGHRQLEIGAEIMTENTPTHTLAQLGDLARRLFLQRNAPDLAAKETGITATLRNLWPAVPKSVLLLRFHDLATHGCAICFPTFSCNAPAMRPVPVLPVHPNKVIPDMYAHLIAEREQGITPGLFVKTHEPFDRLKKHIPAPALQRCKHVYIFRSPGRLPGFILSPPCL